jgi:hypothetical protein
MTAVVYSVLADDHGRYEWQWSRSVASLRRRCPDVPVLTCVFGSVPAGMPAVAREHRIDLLDMGAYPAVFADLPPTVAEVLQGNRLVHKMVSLRRAHRLLPTDPLLYLDSDTYVFGDVGTLTAVCERADWLAREEPGSRRSAGGPDPAWVDEDLLSAVAAAEGLVVVPAYNTGVFAVSPRLARALVELVDEFLWYVWRLLVGAALGRPEVFTDGAQLRRVRQAASGYDARLALPYPAGDIWIVDEVATWLLLGRVPGAVLDTFAPHEVAQGEEYLRPALDPVLVHYFTAHGAKFDAYLAGTS